VSTPPHTDPSSPDLAGRSGGALGVLGALPPVALAVLGWAPALQAPVDVYDGGLIMTLARFTGWSYLPYRDLWTLYGPGPPALTSVVADLTGAGVGQIRVTHLVVVLVLVGGAYLLLLRFLPWWAAMLLGCVVATVGSPQGHQPFSMSIAFLFWGLWFIDRVSDDRARGALRAVIGAALIGLSFLGRFEFAVVAMLMVLVITWGLRRASLHREARAALVAGLTPPVLFGLYVLLVVGWDRAFLNLLSYPFWSYPLPACRGLPTMWGEAFHALVAPLAGRLWQPSELTFGVGTYVPPLVGGPAAVWGFIAWHRSKSMRPLIGALLGVLTLFIWLEMRTRSSAEPSPVWPTMLAVAGLLLGRLWALRAKAAAGLVAVLAGTLLSPVPFGWIPERASAWMTFPQWDSRFGFARIEQDGVLFNPEAWGPVRRIVHRYTSPREPVFVALDRNTGHFANVPLLYWYLDRPPASRFIEFNPCLTDTEAVQRAIVEDLSDTKVVVTTNLFPDSPPPFGAPAMSLDSYLEAEYSPVFTASVSETPAGPFRMSVLLRDRTRTGTDGRVKGDVSIRYHASTPSEP
jgi:hypothetical protein